MLLKFHQWRFHDDLIFWRWQDKLKHLLNHSFLYQHVWAYGFQSVPTTFWPNDSIFAFVFPWLGKICWSIQWQVWNHSCNSNFLLQLLLLPSDPKWGLCIWSDCLNLSNDCSIETPLTYKVHYPSLVSSLGGSSTMKSTKHCPLIGSLGSNFKPN